MCTVECVIFALTLILELKSSITEEGPANNGRGDKQTQLAVCLVNNV